MLYRATGSVMVTACLGSKQNTILAWESAHRTEVVFGPPRKGRCCGRCRDSRTRFRRLLFFAATQGERAFFGEEIRDLAEAEEELAGRPAKCCGRSAERAKWTVEAARRCVRSRATFWQSQAIFWVNLMSFGPPLPVFPYLFSILIRAKFHSMCFSLGFYIVYVCNGGSWCAPLWLFQLLLVLYTAVQLRRAEAMRRVWPLERSGMLVGPQQEIWSRCCAAVAARFDWGAAVSFWDVVPVGEECQP
mmetsp:Transcript_48482/g.110093  ORF Transcript_48482/g.110093 Transcript_48482/m.110093 type:complete len:246 (+) Transcript_48482:1-738(+)